MSEKDKQAEIPPQAFNLYDQYAHGMIDRRQFMAGLAGIAVGGLTAGSLLGALLPNYAQAQQVSFNDPEIQPRYQTFDSPKGHGEGRGYLVAPAGLEGKAPTVLVVHENRGVMGTVYLSPFREKLSKLPPGLSGVDKKYWKSDKT